MVCALSGFAEDDRTGCVTNCVVVCNVSLWFVFGHVSILLRAIRRIDT